MSVEIIRQENKTKRITFADAFKAKVKPVEIGLATALTSAGSVITYEAVKNQALANIAEAISRQLIK